jgi:hypothetical protein
MRKFKLSNGGIATIDNDIYKKIKGQKWYKNKCGYVARDSLVKGLRIRLLLHREVMGFKKGDGKFVDHISGNLLDNRRKNLRSCTRTENQRNVKIHKRNSTGYKGVTYSKEKGKYKAQICAKHIKYFSDIIEAAKAYDEKARELFGKFARTNF